MVSNSWDMDFIHVHIHDGRARVYIIIIPTISNQQSICNLNLHNHLERHQKILSPYPLSVNPIAFRGDRKCGKSKCQTDELSNGETTNRCRGMDRNKTKKCSKHKIINLWRLHINGGSKWEKTPKQTSMLCNFIHVMQWPCPRRLVCLCTV